MSAGNPRNCQEKALLTPSGKVRAYASPWRLGLPQYIARRRGATKRTRWQQVGQYDPPRFHNRTQALLGGVDAGFEVLHMPMQGGIGVGGGQGGGAGV